MYKKGDKVLYSGIDKGIVKTDQEYKDSVFVVYSCCEDWNDYENYTAQNTPINKLTKGWAKSGSSEWCDENGGCKEFRPGISKWSYEGTVYCIDCGRSNK